MIKMVVEVWKKRDMSTEDFAHHWLIEHGKLAKEQARAMGFVRYVQSHKLPSPALDTFAAGRGWKGSPDGLTEVWWESEAAMTAALASPEGQAASAILAEDEIKFTETKQLSAFLATEEVIFDFRPES